MPKCLLTSLFCLALSALAAPAGAACVADGALATARWIFSRAYWFHTERMPEAADFLSPSLLALMEEHWQCRAGGAKDCGIEGDPWTNAAEGDALDPVVFSLRTSPPERTRVAMRYMRGEEPGAAELVMVPGEDGCYRLDDIVGGAGRSLREALEARRAR